MRSTFDPKVDEREPNLAREGTIWMCGACGKTHKDRLSTCPSWSVLVLESSIVRDETGRAVSAEAVNDPEAQLTW